jgi:hypothetical protein
MTQIRVRHLGREETATSEIGRNGPILRRDRPEPSMSSVDGSRVARAKLTQWHWSGAVFCPAC